MGGESGQILACLEFEIIFSLCLSHSDLNWSWGKNLHALPRAFSEHWAGCCVYISFSLGCWDLGKLVLTHYPPPSPCIFIHTLKLPSSAMIKKRTLTTEIAQNWNAICIQEVCSVLFLIKSPKMCCSGPFSLEIYKFVVICWKISGWPVSVQYIEWFNCIRFLTVYNINRY